MKAERKTTNYLQGDNYPDDFGCLIRNHGGQTEVEQYFPSAERKN